MSKERGKFYIGYNDTENEWWVMLGTTGVAMCVNKENCQTIADLLNEQTTDIKRLKAENDELKLKRWSAQYSDDETKAAMDRAIKLDQDNTELRRQLAISEEVKSVMTHTIADLRRQLAEAKMIITGLLTSADAMWEERNMGHDWPKSCESAREFVRSLIPAQEDSNAGS